MIRSQTLVLITVLIISPLVTVEAYAQTAGQAFERGFGDVKFLDAYFGIKGEKFEVEPGDINVPFTVILANVGTQDITGIRGQLSLPFGFSPADGQGALILADNDENSLAGDVFALTFFVNVDKDVAIGLYPGTVKVDYSRLRESGIRNSFFDFNFKVTGDSFVTLKAIDPILTSIKNNQITIEVSNPGTAPVSNVDIVLQNTQTSVTATAESITNLENVVFDQNHWDIGTVAPKSINYFSFNVYIPANLKDEPLHTPVEITYFNAHGDRNTITRTIDFYINGLVDASIYGVDVIDLSGKQIVIGQVLNEGNVDGLFAFATMEPLGDSNIKKLTQYIDELEPVSPVPFNIPVEFEGEPRFGEHDIRITIRYKDSLRNENIITHDATIFLRDSEVGKSDFADFSQFIILGVVAGIGGVAFVTIRRRKRKVASKIS